MSIPRRVATSRLSAIAVAVSLLAGGLAVNSTSAASTAVTAQPAAIADVVDPAAACAPTQTADGDYVVLTFAAGVACDWTVPSDARDIDYLVVGGGGGGGGGGRHNVGTTCTGASGAGSWGGGGAGGAGGQVTTGNWEVEPDDVISVEVAAGGTGGEAGSCSNGGVGGDGTDGGDSTLTYGESVETAAGGGGGDGAPGNGAGAAQGGATGEYVGGEQTASGTTCPWNTTGTCFVAGGGAGAGGDGGDPLDPTDNGTNVDTNGGAGGDGVASSITGTAVEYGGGGGGGIRHPNTNPRCTVAGLSSTCRVGGLGVDGGGDGSTDDTFSTNGFDGTDGLGGGGGGGRANGNSIAGATNAGVGGAGGDGVVVLRYLPYVTPTVTYTGHAGWVNPGTSISLSVSVDPAECTGDVTYEVTNLLGDSVATITGSTAAASTWDTTGLLPGVYSLTASYAGMLGCDPASTTVTLVVATPGDATTGGGWYRVADEAYEGWEGNARVHFGHTVQQSVKFDRRTGAYTYTQRGQLLWMVNGHWRLKAALHSVRTITGSGSTGDDPVFGGIPCPEWVGQTGSAPTCGVILGLGVLQYWVDDEWGGYWETADEFGDEGTVRFMATLYDGGRLSTCRKRSCALTELGDYFGMTIDGVTVADGIPVGAPLQLHQTNSSRLIINYT